MSTLLCHSPATVVSPSVPVAGHRRSSQSPTTGASLASDHMATTGGSASPCRPRVPKKSDKHAKHELIAMILQSPGLGSAPFHSTSYSLITLITASPIKRHPVFIITFKAAADGSSGSLLKVFVFSTFKFTQCRFLTSRMLKSTGAPGDG